MFKGYAFVTTSAHSFLPSGTAEQQVVLQQQRPINETHKHSSKKLLVILHGKRIDDESVRAAVDQIRSEGHEVHVRVTWDSGDVDNFVREAVELWDSHSYDTLVAGGGDGTLNELVAALLKHNAPQHLSIAQLPLGTANDLASATGISLAPLDALRLALDPANIHPVDIALVNGEVFMNLTTAGPVSEVSSKGMSDALKKALGPAAVAVAGFRQLFITGLQPIKNVKITYPTTLDTKHDDDHRADQVSQLRGDLLVLAAGQARQMGRMINVCPDALLDDGLLDFTLLFGSAKRQAADLASDVLSLGLSQAQGGVQLLRVPWLVVEADEDLKCNRDGEPSPPSKKLVFEVIPRRINMHLPDTRLLVDGQNAAAPTGVEAAGSERSAGRTLKRTWSMHRRTTMKVGSKPRPRLLLDLWKAQHPPGRLSRLLPKVKKLIGRTLVYGALVGAGVAVGMGLSSSAILSGHDEVQTTHMAAINQAPIVEQVVAMNSSRRVVDTDTVVGQYTYLETPRSLSYSVTTKQNVCQPKAPQHVGSGVHKIRPCVVPRQSMPMRKAPPLFHAQLL